MDTYQHCKKLSEGGFSSCIAATMGHSFSLSVGLMGESGPRDGKDSVKLKSIPAPDTRKLMNHRTWAKVLEIYTCSTPWNLTRILYFGCWILSKREPYWDAWWLGYLSLKQEAVGLLTTYPQPVGIWDRLRATENLKSAPEGDTLVPCTQVTEQMESPVGRNGKWILKHRLDWFISSIVCVHFSLLIRFKIAYSKMWTYCFWVNFILLFVLQTLWGGDVSFIIINVDLSCRMSPSEAWKTIYQAEGMPW